MGGGFRFPGNGSRTVVLLGHTGNGKSATGNSILGMKAFESRTSMLSVTNNVECLTTTIADGEVVNVIDTPGLFDPSFGPEFISKEIEKCIDLANDGIHAILLVFSVRTRFTEEKCDAIENLQKIFGPKITDYIILVFTGGDSLEKNQSLENFLLRCCPDSLKNVLDVCRNRMVLFDNKTKDEKTKAAQLQRLIGLVDKVIEENDGKPYTTEEKIESKASNGSHDEQLKWMMDKVECKLMETIKDLQQQLEEEKSDRLNGDKIAEDAQKRSEEEIQKLSERLAEDRLNCDKIEDTQNRSEEENQKLSERLAEAQKASDYEMKELRNNLANDKKIAEDAKKRSDEEIHKLSEKLAAAPLNDEKIAQRRSEELSERLAEAQKDSDYEMKELRNNLANVKKLAEDAQKIPDEEIQQLSEKLAAAHLNAEKIARDAQKRSEEEIQKLSERLDEAQKISDEVMKEVRKNLANIKKNDMNLNVFRLVSPSSKRSRNCPTSG